MRWTIFLQQNHKLDCTDLVFCHGSVDDATSEKRMEESAMCSRRHLAVCVYRDNSSAKSSYHRRRGGFSLGRERSKYVVVRRGYFQGSERHSFMDFFTALIILCAGFGSVAIVCFSPTIYASGSRIFIFCYYAVYLLISFLLKKLCPANAEKGELLILSVTGLCSFASFLKNLFFLIS